MGKKEQVPARAACDLCAGFFVGVVAARRRLAGVVLAPPDGGLRLVLAVFHMVPRVPAAPNLFVHPPADLRKVLLPQGRPGPLRPSDVRACLLACAWGMAQ